eukprot:1158584-Pelagomonas_calceolata.AAC.3
MAVLSSPKFPFTLASFQSLAGNRGHQQSMLAAVSIHKRTKHLQFMSRQQKRQRIPYNQDWVGGVQHT